MAKRILYGCVFCAVLSICWSVGTRLNAPRIRKLHNTSHSHSDFTENGSLKSSEIPSELSSAERAPSVLVRWNEVPYWIAGAAAYPCSSGRMESERPLTWYDLLNSVQLQGPYTLNPVDLDLHLRSIGLVSAIDATILEKCGFSFAKWQPVPDHYFPNFTSPDVRTQPEADQFYRGLVEIIQNPEGLLNELPPRFRTLDVLEGIKARALILSSQELLHKSDLNHILFRELDSGSSSVRVSAALALMGRGEENAVNAWVLKSLHNDDALRLVSGMAATQLKGVAVLDGDNSFIYYAPVAHMGRIHDTSLMRLAQIEPPESPLKYAALRALSHRCDNAFVADYVLTTLAGTDDPKAACAIMASGTSLLDHPGYTNTLGKWLHHEDRGASLWALHSLSLAPSRTHEDDILRFLGDDDPHYVHGALQYLLRWGRSLPDVVQAMHLKLKDKWSHDPLVYTSAVSLRNLSRPSHQQAHRRRVSKAVDLGFTIFHSK